MARVGKVRRGLNDRLVRNAPPGRHHDGDGLYLDVKPSGSRSWTLRAQKNGRRRDYGLGPYPVVSLADAREAAMQIRRQLHQGVDPLAERARAKAERVVTFKEAAEKCIQAKAHEWSNDKHAYQWRQSLETYAYPHIGDLSVRDIETAHIVGLLEPIWTTKTETATRVRQRIEAVLSYAKAVGWRDGENPARWRGHLDQTLPEPGRVRPVEHYPALPYAQMPALMQTLAARGGMAALALRFIALTAVRSGEARKARWREFDLAWIIHEASTGAAPGRA
jgi:hypothetical protein